MRSPTRGTSPGATAGLRKASSPGDEQKNRPYDRVATPSEVGLVKIFAFLLFLLISAAPLAAAPLDPEVNVATRWQILVRTGRHPLFDATFRDGVCRELKAALQPGLGRLGTVEVIDLAAMSPEKLDPPAVLFLEKGWPALDPSPTRPLTGVKSHFLTIDFVDGGFRLAARQYDGFTGLTSPLLRTQTVRSADLVARAAGLLIEPDFGPVGTVEIIPADAAHVTLVLRGSTLAPADSRVAAGDVFAVGVLSETKAPAGTKPEAMLTAITRPQTLLKVVEPPQGGRCKCLILSSYEASYEFGREFRNRKAAGVRAMKLPTVTAPVRLKLVGRDGKPHPKGSLLRVLGTDLDFTVRPGRDDGFEWRDGVYRSTRPLANIACVSVAIGEDRPQLFPLPVLGEAAVSLVFEIDPKAERRALFARECTDLRARVAELCNAQVALFTATNRLIDDARNREAFNRASEGHARFEANVAALAEELKQLQEQPAAKDAGLTALLTDCSRQIGVVRDGQTKMAGHVNALKEAIAKASDPATLEKDFRGRELADRIKDLLARGDVPEALEAYEQLIKLFPAEATYKDGREKLRTEWAPKDDEHRAARDVLRTLPAARTAAEFRTVVAAMKTSVPILKRKKDRLGLRKLKNVFEPAIVALALLVNANDDAAASDARVASAKELEDIQIDLRQVELMTTEALREVIGK